MRVKLFMSKVKSDNHLMVITIIYLQSGFFSEANELEIWFNYFHVVSLISVGYLLRKMEKLCMDEY
jgi:hypothetical protein